MFQLGFSLEHDNQTPHWWMDVIRAFFALFDKVVYSLIMIMYEILFNLADATIIQSETMVNFYSRVQLIIGVYMIFKVSISLMQAVMNPDQLTNKDTGLGKIITRIVTMLALFAAIIPLNIPNAEEGSYNAYLNENGLLFGVLYSLQARILDQNVLGKLILGTKGGTTSSSAESGDELLGGDKSSSARSFATFVLKTFVRINLKKNATEEGPADASNYYCDDTVAFQDKTYYESYEDYKDENLSPTTLLDDINIECNVPATTKERYIYVYTPVISTIVGVVFIFVLFGFCIDIAIRSIKLAVLRLLAPIPIISYIDPKSSKDGSFAAWVKTLTSTYLDLFLRLLIIFFVLFLVQEVIEHGLEIPIGTGIVGMISTVFVFIGMFYFAKMAPKFLKDALGLKGNLSNFGLSAMLAGAGAFRTGGSLYDAFDAGRTATDAQIAAYNQGKQAPGIGQSYTSGRDYMAQQLTGDKNMTYRQMHRGEKALDRMGLTPGRVDAKKDEMYKLMDEAAVMNSIKDKVNNNGWSSLSNDEKSRVEEAYRLQHGIAEDADLTAQQMSDLITRGATDAYNYIQTKAKKTESEYKTMDDELTKRGGSRNSYRAKYGDLRERHPGERNTRFSDLLTHEGRDAIRTGDFRETMRNIAAMPRNGRLASIDEVNAEIKDIIEADEVTTAKVNAATAPLRKNKQDNDND